VPRDLGRPSLVPPLVGALAARGAVVAVGAVVKPAAAGAAQEAHQGQTAALALLLVVAVVSRSWLWGAPLRAAQGVWVGRLAAPRRPTRWGSCPAN
jgi:hypothetical protein